MVAGRDFIFNRDATGKVGVFYNLCTHRGGRVCRERSGKATIFQCFYHGWVFNTDGSLRGIPQEGAYPEGGEMVIKKTVEHSPESIRLGGISHQLAADIEGRTRLEARVTILGHLLRGGSPTPADRLLATRFGCEAVHLAAESQFGRLVVLKGSDISSVALSDIAGQIRTVPLDSPLIKLALSTGVSLGVEKEKLPATR